MARKYRICKDYIRDGELPKLKVAGSIPVARSSKIGGSRVFGNYILDKPMLVVIFFLFA